MLEETADATLDKVKQFTVGFARAGEKPAAKGSGVLVRCGKLVGILTCAHVDTLLRKTKQPVGLVRLNRGLSNQFGTLNMDEVDSYAVGGEDEDEDIAFIHLPPHLVGNIEKDSVFLDVEKNFTKPQPNDRSSLIVVHSVFGLVEKFTGATTRQNGMATTFLKSVLTPGILREPTKRYVRTLPGKHSRSP